MNEIKHDKISCDKVSGVIFAARLKTPLYIAISLAMAFAFFATDLFLQNPPETVFAQDMELVSLYDRAMFEYSRANYEASLPHFSKIILSAPNSPYASQAAFYYGRALIKLNREAEALELWDKYYQKNQFLGIRNELFKLYEKFGMLEKKLGEFAEKIKKNPDDRTLRHEYIEFLIYLNKADEALAQYDQLIAREPGNYFLNKNAGDLLIKFKRFKDALKYYEKLLSVQPDNELYLEATGNVYYQLGDREKAKSYWFKIISKKNELHKYNLLANILSSHNMIDDAIEVYRQCQREHGNSTIYFAELAELYEVKNDYKELLKHYFQLLDYNQAFFSSVEQKLADTLKKNPDAREPLCKIAYDEFKNEIKSNALKAKLASTIFLFSKKYSWALEMNILIAGLTSNAIALEDYSKTLADLGELKLAGECLDIIRRMYPKSAAAYNALYMKAKLMERMKNYDEALALFDMVTSDRDFSELAADSILNGARLCFDMLNNPQKAIHRFDSLEKIAPSTAPETIYYRALYSLYLGDFKTAETMISTLAAIPEKKGEADFLGAYSLVYQGSYEAAVNSFNDFLSAAPACENAGEIFEVISLIRSYQGDEAKKLQPFFDAERKYWLGDFNQSAAEALALMPLKGRLGMYSLDLYLESLLKLKQYDKFRNAILESIEEISSDQKKADLLYNLGTHYFDNEKKALEAKNCLEQLLKKYPQSLYNYRSKEKIKQINGGDTLEGKKRISFFNYI